MKKILKIVGIIGAVILLIIVVSLVATNPAASAAKEHFSLMSSGNYRNAYAMTTQEFQDVTSYEDFVSFIDTYNFGNTKGISFSSKEVDGGLAMMEGVVTTLEGTKIPIIYRLSKASGSWKVFSIDYNY